MFHIGIDIGRTATDCVLIDQAEPGAAVAYQVARALAMKDGPADREGRTYPVSPWFLAARLAPVLAGRPFTIVPVTAPQTRFSQTRVDHAVTQVYEQMALLAGSDPLLAVRSAAARSATDRDASPQDQARFVVRQLRRPMADAGAKSARAWPEQAGAAAGTPEERMGLPARVREAVLAAGDAVAGLYAAVLTGEPLSQGWVADVQLPGGLWIRPAGPAEQVAAERAALDELPQAPLRGLVVVGLSGRAVPPELWPAFRQAGKQVPEQDRVALLVRVRGTMPSAD